MSKEVTLKYSNEVVNSLSVTATVDVEYLAVKAGLSTTAARTSTTRESKKEVMKMEGTGESFNYWRQDI